MDAELRTYRYHDLLKTRYSGELRWARFELIEVRHCSDDGENVGFGSDCFAGGAYLQPPYVVAKCRYESRRRPGDRSSGNEALSKKQEGSSERVRFVRKDSEFDYTVPSGKGVGTLKGCVPYVQSYASYSGICEFCYDDKNSEWTLHLLKVVEVRSNTELRMKDVKFMLSMERGTRNDVFPSVRDAYIHSLNALFGKNAQTIRANEPFLLELLEHKPCLHSLVKETIDKSKWNLVVKYRTTVKYFPVLSLFVFRWFGEEKSKEFNELLKGDEVYDLTLWGGLSSRLGFLEQSIKYTMWLNEVKRLMSTEPGNVFRGEGRSDSVRFEGGRFFLDPDRWENKTSYEYVSFLKEKLARENLNDLIGFVERDNNLLWRLAEIKKTLYFRFVDARFDERDSSEKKAALSFYRDRLLPHLDRSGNTVFNKSDFSASPDESTFDDHVRTLQRMNCIVAIYRKVDGSSESDPLAMFKRHVRKLGGLEALYSLSEFKKASDSFLENIYNLPKEPVTMRNRVDSNEYKYRRCDLLSDPKAIEACATALSDATDRSGGFGRIAGHQMSYWTNEMVLDDCQLRCLDAVANTPVTVIVANPGRGKTVVIEALYDAFGGNGSDGKDRVSVVTHGGCMASGLRERGMSKANTVDRIIYDSFPGYLAEIEEKRAASTADGTDRRHRPSDRERLRTDEVELLIVDEASNVSQKKMTEITSQKIFPNLKRIVLVLDVSQTLPLESGSPAIDLIKNSPKWRRERTAGPAKDCDRNKSVLYGLVTVCVLNKAHRYENARSTNCFNDECLLIGRTDALLFGEVDGESVGSPKTKYLPEKYEPPVGIDEKFLRAVGDKLVVNSFAIRVPQTIREGRASAATSSRESDEMRTVRFLVNNGKAYARRFDDQTSRALVWYAEYLDTGKRPNRNALEYETILRDDEETGNSNDSFQMLCLSKKVLKKVNEICDEAMGRDFIRLFRRFRNRDPNVGRFHYLGRKIVFKKNIPRRVFRIELMENNPKWDDVIESGLKKKTKKSNASEKPFVPKKENRWAENMWEMAKNKYDLLDLSRGFYSQTAVYNGKSTTFLGTADLYVGDFADSFVHGYVYRKSVKKLSRLPESKTNKEVVVSILKRLNRRRWMNPETRSTNDFDFEKNCSVNPFKKMMPLGEAVSSNNVGDLQNVLRFAFFSDGSRLCLNASERGENVGLQIESGWCITTNSAQGREYEGVMLIIEKENVNDVFGLRHAHVALSRAKSAFYLIGGANRFVEIGQRDSDVLNSRETYLNLLLKGKI